MRLPMTAATNTPTSLHSSSIDIATVESVAFRVGLWTPRSSQRRICLPVDPETVADAIREIESHGNQAALGDSGMAIGAYQQHPAFFWMWFEKPAVRATWDEVFRLACLNFIDAMLKAYPDIDADDIALVYHLHGYVRRATPDDWNDGAKYVDDFRRAYGEPD